MAKKKQKNNRGSFFHSFIHVIWMALNLLVAVPLLLADLSVVIPPSVMRLPAVFGLGFEVLFWTNLFFALSWLFSHRKSWCVLSLAVLVLSAGSAFKTWSYASPAPDYVTGQFSVLSYNTMALQKSTPVKKNEVLRYVRDCGADVVCLQEYCVRKDKYYPTFESAKKYLSKEYPYSFFDFAHHTDNLQFGLAVYSKYPLINKHSIAVESAYNGACYCDVVLPDGEGGKDTVRLFNSHLESNAFQPEELDLSATELNTEGVKSSATKILRKLGVGYKKRTFQVQAVQKEIKASPYPVVVCGDFNDVPVSYTYSMMSRGLKDAFLENSTLKKGYTFEKHNLGIRIDYILHSPSLQSSDFMIDTVRCSDHFPVRCTLCW